MSAKKGRPSKYPWEEWFDAGAFKVPRASYKCSRYSMMQQIRNNASERGLGVTIVADDHGSFDVKVKEV